MKKLIQLALVLSVSAFRKEKDKKYEMNEKHGDMSKELYCAGCRAVVTESLKYLMGSKNEMDIYFVLENVCDRQYTDSYQYRPHLIAEACTNVLIDFEAKVADELRLRDDDMSDKDLIKEICEKQTQACLKVDMQQFKPPRLRLNDKVTDSPKYHYGWKADPD